MVCYLNCKTLAKSNFKGCTLIVKYSRFFFDDFSVKIDLFSFEPLRVGFIYPISSSQNFVTFSSKTDKVIKKSYFFEDSAILRTVAGIIEHVLNQFSNKWELLFLVKSPLTTIALI